jgi:hypothetical protein
MAPPSSSLGDESTTRTRDVPGQSAFGGQQQQQQQQGGSFQSNLPGQSSLGGDKSQLHQQKGQNLPGQKQEERGGKAHSPA